MYIMKLSVLATKISIILQTNIIIGKKDKTNAVGLAKGFANLEKMNPKPAPMQIVNGSTEND